MSRLKTISEDNKRSSKYTSILKERITTETTMDLEDNNLPKLFVQDLVADVVLKDDTTVQQTVDL
jgi:hypothetical protein